MAYFSNSTEGKDYQEQYCVHCVHDVKSDCPVWLLHLTWNYVESNYPDSFLHVLIPRKKDGIGNEQCRMFVPIKKP